MQLADYYLYADWNRDDSWDHEYSDLSAYIMDLAWEYGIDMDSDRAKFGTIRATLDNSTSIFSSFNAASPLVTPSLLILPGVPIKITMDTGSGEGTMFVGYLESIIPTPGPTVGTSTAELMAYGPLSLISNSTVHIPLQTNATTGALLELILAASGFPGTASPSASASKTPSASASRSKSASPSSSKSASPSSSISASPSAPSASASSSTSRSPSSSPSASSSSSASAS